MAGGPPLLHLPDVDFDSFCLARDLSQRNQFHLASENEAAVPKFPVHPYSRSPTFLQQRKTCSQRIYTERQNTPICTASTHLCHTLLASQRNVLPRCPSQSRWKQVPMSRWR